MNDLVIFSIFSLGALFWIAIEVNWLHRRLAILEKLLADIVEPPHLD